MSFEFAWQREQREAEMKERVLRDVEEANRRVAEERAREEEARERTLVEERGRQQREIIENDARRRHPLGSIKRSGAECIGEHAIEAKRGTDRELVADIEVDHVKAKVWLEGRRRGHRWYALQSTNAAGEAAMVHTVSDADIIVGGLASRYVDECRLMLVCEGEPKDDAKVLAWLRRQGCG
jgi:hypothetical protein